MSSDSLSLDDVAGLEYQKSVLYNALILPEKFPDTYASLVRRPEMVRERNVFLFHGPPGSGKTLLARAAARESGVPYREAQATQFINELAGKGAAAIRHLYNQEGPGLLFIDEVDAIARSRSQHRHYVTDDLLMQLLMAVDGPGSDDEKVTVLCTNRYDVLDNALLSRVPEDHQLHFPMPDQAQRYKIIEKHLSYHNHHIDEYQQLVSFTEGFDGRQIEALFKRARTNALLDDRPYLHLDDFFAKHAYKSFGEVHDD
ncbi:MAG: AAA family ATPase [Candidatus Woesearchaeota archaeon]